MHKVFLTAIIVSLWIALVPIVSATHSVIVSDIHGSAVATQSNPLSTCPRPLTPQDILIKVKNTGTIVDTYTVDVDIPSGWEIGMIRSDFSLGPGQTGEINPFLISYIPSNTLPDVYNIDVTVTSSNKAYDSVTKSFYVEILECHSIASVAVDTSRSVCEEDAIEETYHIDFKNNGKYTETVDITTSVGWAAPSAGSMILGVGETKTVDIIANPPSDVTGKQNIVVTASSPTTYVEASETLVLDIQPCYGVISQLQPMSKNICLEESTTYDLVLTNAGKADTYTLSAPIWVSIPEQTVSLDENEEVTITLTVTPPNAGVSSFDVSMDSDRTSSVVTGTVNAEECRDVTVFLFPDEKTVCVGETLDYTISIKNTGKMSDTFYITPTVGSVEVTSVEIPAGQTRSIDYFVDTIDLSGDVILGVKAESSNSNIFDQASSKLVLENCYAAEVNIIESSREVCPFFETSFTINAKNTGKKADNYNLKVEQHTEAFTLQPGQSKEIEIPVLANADSGEFEIVADLTSPHVSLSDSAALTVKTTEQCFSSEIVRAASNGAIVVEEQKGVVVPIKVKNTGEEPGSYDISSDGPDWTYLRPANLDLDAQDEDNIYLYLLPPFGTPSGEYEVVVTAESVRSTASITVMVTVVSETPPEALVSEVPEVIVEEEPAEEIPEETAEPTEIPVIDLEENTEQSQELGEAGQATLLINQGEHMITVDVVTEEAIEITIESDPLSVGINAGESKKIDMDGDGVYDLKITYNGLVDGKADLTYEKIEEEIPPEELVEEGIPEEILEEEALLENNTELMLEVNDSDDGKVTLNVSIGNDAGLTGTLIGETPFWKTVTVAVITVIIIIILVIRFSFLLK